MKKLLITIITVALNGSSLWAQAPTPPVFAKQVERPAYIDETILKVSGIKNWTEVNFLGNADKITVRKYVDGLGRPLQQIDFGKGNTAKSDMVTFHVYDSHGNEKKKYLPYAVNSDKLYQSEPVAGQHAFYATANASGKYAKDDMAFSERNFDSSPLNTVLQEGSVGTDWQLSTGKVKNHVYRTNTVADSVRQLNADGTSVGLWPVGRLKVTQSVDEDGSTSTTFVDNEDKLVLVRSWVDETIQGSYKEYKETYHTYRFAGQQSMIIPPKVSDRMKSNGWMISGDDLENNIYRYEYDDKGRVIAKKVPSSGWAYFIYDKLDRLTMVQTPAQRLSNSWSFVKYDKLGRRILEGILQDNLRTTPLQMQAYCNGYDYFSAGVVHYESRGGAQMGYSDVTFPQSSGGFASFEILTAYYYDSYDIDNDGSANYSCLGQGLGADEPVVASAQGKETIISSKILGTADWLTKVFFYDRDGQVIQQQSNNVTNLAVVDVHTNIFDFAGLLKRSIKKKTINGTQHTFDESLSYDNLRVTAVSNKYNTAQAVTIAEYEYNELGQMVDKNLGKYAPSGYLQSVDYRYNIRGWLTHINNADLSNDGYNTESNDLFGMEFLYQDTDIIGNESLYAGLVTGVKWRSKMIGHPFDNIARAYTYSYDKLGQIKNALFKANNGSGWTYKSDAYSEKNISYDLGGNILALERNMMTTAGNVIQMDKLSYSYKTVGGGDRLRQVSDEYANAGSYGFRQGSTEEEQYLYDVAGNLIEDKNKGATYTYNAIGKVDRVTLPGTGRYIQYRYSGNGECLGKQVVDNGSTVSTLSYADDFVAEDNLLSYITTIEGRLRTVGGTGTYEYFIKDNLGNVRVSFENREGIAAIIQENSYYAFGLVHSATIVPSGGNKKLYNDGSEWENDFSNDPDLFSTPLRQYDPVLGRFNAIDVIGEEFADINGYSYAFNSPIGFNDPTGAYPNYPPGTYYPGDPIFENWLQSNWALFNIGGTYAQYMAHGYMLPEVMVYGMRNANDWDSDLFRTSSMDDWNKRAAAQTAQSVGQPGFGESLIPVWGSGRAAVDHFQNGNYWRGLGYTALAVTDVFLVKAAVTAVAKGTITLAAKYAVKKAVRNPSLSVREAAVLGNPKVSALMKGKGIDRAFREIAKKNLILGPAEKIGLIKINPMNKGADMVGKGILNGYWWDVTTKGSWGSHVSKYGAGGTGLFY